MSWTKIAIWIIVIPILILVLLVSFYFANYLVIGPIRHYFNTEWAEEINADTWENGFADIYTVEAKIEINGETKKQTQDVVFVRKIETADTTFKNGRPMIWDSVRNFSQYKRHGTVIAFPISDTYRFRYSFRPTKEKLERLFEGSQTRLYLDAQLIYKGTPETICHYKTENGSAVFGKLKAFPIRVLSKKSLRVKEVISKEEFEPADRAVKREIEHSKLTAQEFWARNRNRGPHPSSFHRSVKEQCWWGNRGCPQIAQKLCEL